MYQNREIKIWKDFYFPLFEIIFYKNTYRFNLFFKNTMTILYQLVNTPKSFDKLSTRDKEANYYEVDHRPVPKSGPLLEY